VEWLQLINDRQDVFAQFLPLPDSKYSPAIAVAQTLFADLGLRGIRFQKHESPFWRGIIPEHH